jgi:hypothetical protein
VKSLAHDLIEVLTHGGNSPVQFLVPLFAAFNIAVSQGGLALYKRYFRDFVLDTLTSTV